MKGKTVGERDKKSRSLERMINAVIRVCTERYVEKKGVGGMKFQEKNRRRKISAGLRGHLKKGKSNSIYISMKIRVTIINGPLRILVPLFLSMLYLRWFSDN